MWLDWLVFCGCGFSLSALWCPLLAPTVLLGFLLPWTWGISSQPLATPALCSQLLNIQKTKIMTSSPIISWQIDGETVVFILGSSKITADGDCNHEIKRHLLLGRKAMTNLESILKSRDITLPTKIHLIKAVVFPVVMYGCESWTIKNAEHWIIDAFELWCWRVPWTATSPS